MKIIMGADPFGFSLKQAVKKALLEKGYEVDDVNPDAPLFYQTAAEGVARGVQSGKYDRGIAMCGTGMGVSIVCNKFRGVYAALVESVYTARRAKVVNNTNVLVMGGMIVGEQMGIDMALAWLEAEHLEGVAPDQIEQFRTEALAIQKTEERCY